MKPVIKNCDPKICFLCRHCIDEWIPAIERYKNVLSFKKGEYLFKEQEPVKGIYFLYSGKVKVHKYWEGDKEMIIRFAKSGDIIGHRGLGKNTTYPVSATALEDVTVCFIDSNFLMQTIGVNKDFALQLVMFYADELQDAENRIRNLALMDVKGRIADTLLMLHKNFGADSNGFIDIKLTRQDIASYAGTIYETFFKIATEMESQQIIRFSGKQIKLLKQEKLQEYARLK